MLAFFHRQTARERIIIPDMFNKSAIVCAHPDDEILWFSSVLDKVDKVIVCFLGISSDPNYRIGRQSALKEYPLKNVSCLGLNESETFYGVDWDNPVITEYGIEITDKKYPDRLYRENYSSLKNLLASELEGCMNVFTHNPWGEYGHNEHVQIYRVVKELQHKFRFDLWFSNYYSSKSAPLMLKILPALESEYRTLKTNKGLAKKIKNNYKNNECWSWYDKWEWSNKDSFIKDTYYQHLIEENIAKVEIYKKEMRMSHQNLPLNFVEIAIKNRTNNKLNNFNSLHLFYRIKKSLKKMINKFALKFGVEIRKCVPNPIERLITLNPNNDSKGNVLLSYRIEPFLLKPGEPIPNSHTHFWETFQIANTFLKLGYSVDVIDYKNNTFIPNKKYSIFVAARTNFVRIAKQLGENCIKIVHLDTAHWLFNNHASHSRSLALQQRKKVTIESQKIVESNLAIEYADYATLLGNQFTITTYNYAQKPIFRAPISTCAVYPRPEDKDFELCRHNFLWFGSDGFVHKGLDLVLDAFIEIPDYNLYICGPIQKEKDFEKAYYKELYDTSNIHTIGWVDVNTPDFLDISNKCLALIYPSCSEGGGGSVITCMHAGIIPVISYESSVDVDEDFGMILQDCSIDTIKNTIKIISSMPVEKLRQMSFKAWEFARANHTRELFSEEYKKIIQNILKISSL
jgi:LmbE family N-acetylglucosaminyl deacetylase